MRITPVSDRIHVQSDALAKFYSMSWNSIDEQDVKTVQAKGTLYIVTRY